MLTNLLLTFNKKLVKKKYEKRQYFGQKLCTSGADLCSVQSQAKFFIGGFKAEKKSFNRWRCNRDTPNGFETFNFTI